MSIENVIRKRAVLLEDIGRAALNTKYPNEFELYVVALELVDELGNTLKYFIFPVNPSSIDEARPKITRVRKTLAGVSVLSTPTFVPTDIILSGTFGRKFRILLGTDFIDFINAFKTEAGTVSVDSIVAGTGAIFDKRVKTGYGCLKILQEMIDEADTVDENGIRRLILYNPAFGSAYVVKPMNDKVSMSQETNMLHNYYVSLKGIAPLTSLRNEKDIEAEAKRLNTTAYLQKQTDRVVNALTSIFE